MTEQQSAALNPGIAGDSGAEQLAAFEAALFGASARRINGEIERGSGSVFEKLSAADRARHEALEQLVKLERDVKIAEAAADAAKAKLDRATQAHHIASRGVKREDTSWN